MPGRRWAALPLALLPLVAVGLVDPHRPGRYPTCPVRLLLGVDCPGCGSLRALHDLVTGHVVAAADHNALLLVVLPLVAAEGVRWLRGAPAGAFVRWRFAPLGVALVLVVWTVLRNVPAFPFDLLASSAA